MVFDAQRRRWLLPLLMSIGIFVCDQLTKRWIVQTLGPVPLTRSIPVVGDWLNLVYSHNMGVAFGFFSNMPSMSSVLTVVALIISFGALYVYVAYLPNSLWSVQISIGLIIGGAVGNIADRIMLGYVVDFIQVGWFPIFNVADSAITVGAVILACYLLLAPDEELEPPNPQDEQLLADLLHQNASALEKDQR
ncbi:MAG: signal peptidase II [Blastochloris sp.]|nr:signal peptidase II [Blastochloris sp.]